MGLEQTDDHAKPLRGAQGTRPTAPGAGMGPELPSAQGVISPGRSPRYACSGGSGGCDRPGVAATFLVGGFVPDHDEVRSLLVGLPRPGPAVRADLLRPGRPRPVAGVQTAVRELLAPLVTGQSPFAEPPAALVGGRWSRPGPDEPAPVFVRPALAVEVSFLGWGSGRLRHPAYGGLTRIL